METKATLERLLRLELKSVALKLGFIEGLNDSIDDAFLIKLVGLIDQASRRKDDYSARLVVMVCALIWTHSPERRQALTEIMILMLSRVGYSVSSAMIDQTFDRENGNFTQTASWMTECCVAVLQSKSEVMIDGKVLLLTMPQKRMWDKIDEHPVLGISAPTSAGKSYLITLKCVEILRKKQGIVVYIVPTISLVSQVSSDFHAQLGNFGLSDYRIKTTYNSESVYEKTIYVFTQEKAMAAFSQQERPFTHVRVLVVDEIQNIERVAAEDDQRAKRLYDAITEFRHNSLIDHIVISGPRIRGLKTLGIEMFGVDSDSEEVSSSPVASLTYSIYKKRKSVFLFRQYSDLLDEPIELELGTNQDWRWFGQASYTDEFHSFLNDFLKRLGDDAINVVFSPTSRQSRKTALQLLDQTSPGTPPDESDELRSLIEYLKETVHPKYEMCNALENGVAYHHGKVPPHARRAIEHAIKSKLVRNVVCTTTLMQGVNLPAQNIIIRTPKLFVKRQGGYDPVLTNYELANLRGRAGRLFKDLLGRAFVLEENSFLSEGDEKSEYHFKDEHKELSSGYGTIFTAHQDAIESALVEDQRPALDTKEYSYIATYVRQTILRFGDRAEDRLRTAGVFIDASLRMQIQESLSKLKVEREVCLQNRYWDPFDLDLIFRNRQTFRAPTRLDFEFSEQLTRLLVRVREVFPYYCDRYFDVPESEGVVKHFAILASDWMKEKPLSSILSQAYYDNSDKIEKAIEELQGPISYGIPGLLKPVYDITTASSMVPRFIECGAYRPFTRFLIEENIPRETALRIAEVIPTAEKNSFDRLKLPQILLSVRNKVDRWDWLQVENNL